ncbi:protein NLRC3 [Pimephales promelas]|nr:protein NLRC3 [Pimephales promelas]
MKHPDCTLDKLKVDHGGEFMMTSRLHRYAVDLTLDPNTANIDLVLSEENRKVTSVPESQSYPDHPDRFNRFFQVLCRESLTGRCYWEAEWSDYTHISVVYKGIQRKGLSADCRFGRNEKSWSLTRYNNTLSVCHNNISTDVSAGSGSCLRVGVFVDESAGTLSFYSVSDTHTLKHLHTFTHTFTEPLYAGFRLDNVDSSVSLCHVKRQTHSD